MNWRNIATIEKRRSTVFSNGGWNIDAYPDIEPLHAGKSITIGQFSGPGVITHIHSTQHWPYPPTDDLAEREKRKALSARGILIEIYYNDSVVPSVRAPLGDFFGDGCNGLSEYFSSLYIEKAPESYNCYFPMPFEKSVKVMLINETSLDFTNYSFVECETLPEWDASLGYFHAAWDRFDFQLSPDTNKPFFQIDGCGHFLGRTWSICTDESLFRNFFFIMEGNNEIRIDGETHPSIDYLGSEDSFGFSWGFSGTFAGLRNGITCNRKSPHMLGMYRVHDVNPIRFHKSFHLRLNWQHEFKQLPNLHHHLETMRQLSREEDRLWLDYATTNYWYQETVNTSDRRMPPLDRRIAPLLRSNRPVS